MSRTTVDGRPGRLVTNRPGRAAVNRWRRYGGLVSQIPWWGLPTIVILSAVGGALIAQLAINRERYERQRQDRRSRWYIERRSAYVNLLAAFERTVVRLRTGFADGITEPDLLRYTDDVGPALIQVRLLASAPVRNAALAVHLVLESMHGQRSREPAPERHFLERLAHVPLVMHEFEVTVREELGFAMASPQFEPLESPVRWHQRVRALAARLRRPGPVSDSTGVRIPDES